MDIQSTFLYIVWKGGFSTNDSIIGKWNYQQTRIIA